MRQFVPSLTLKSGHPRSGRIGRRTTQTVALGGVLAAHLLVFALLSERRTRILPPQTEGIALSFSTGIGRSPFANASNSAPARDASHALEPVRIVIDKPAPPMIETPVAELKIPVVVRPIQDIQPLPIMMSTSAPAVSADANPSQPNAAGGASAAVNGQKHCEIFEVVQSALQTSQSVRDAIAIIPARARSVANAVMIWDGGWADPGSMGGAPALDPIRNTVLDSVAHAPPSCQDDIVRGPRLITVGDQHDTTVLAFGSGEWRWSDLGKTALQP